jgi:GNAT superfamily N-acetyltransferase
MTSTSRLWRNTRSIDGPQRATADDIVELNAVFTEAFTERYRRDGMTGVRVPALNPAIWRYALDDAGAGALCWRDDRGTIVAFNIVHLAGTEGWMGPLCVRPDQQGLGLGKTIVQSGMQWLQERHARVIGLETMPRTMDNIGFYSALGFVPSHLTVTLTVESARGEYEPLLVSRLAGLEREALLTASAALTEQVLPGYDFTREIDLTDRMVLGDTVILGSPTAPRGFAIYHTVPLVEGRARDELRILKLVLADASDVAEMIGILAELSRRVGTRRVAIRLQGDYPEAYRTLMTLGARVRWTDLRMSAHGWREVAPASGMVLSNWEI